MRRESKHVKIDDSTIAAGDIGLIFDAFWYSVDIYQGPEIYEECVAKLTRGQRLLFAFQWYTSETSNGGHEQFFCNPTGVVYPDALEACREMNLPEHAAILRAALDRFGVDVPRDEISRGDLIEENEIDFHDLDQRLFNLIEPEALKNDVLRFIRSRPSEFYFDGVVEVSKFD